MIVLLPYRVQDAPPGAAEPRWKSLLRAGVAGSLASVLGIGLLVGTGTIGGSTDNPSDPTWAPIAVDPNRGPWIKPQVPFSVKNTSGHTLTGAQIETLMAAPAGVAFECTNEDVGPGAVTNCQVESTIDPKCATIASTIYTDANNNGRMDGREGAGITVGIRTEYGGPAHDLDGNVVRYAVTNPWGVYVFPCLATLPDDGEYSVFDPSSTQPFRLSAHALDRLVGKSWQEAQKVVRTLPSGQQAPTGAAVLAVDHYDTVLAWTTTRDDGTFEFFGLPVDFVTNGTQGRYITVQPAQS